VESDDQGCDGKSVGKLCEFEDVWLTRASGERPSQPANTCRRRHGALSDSSTADAAHLCVPYQLAKLSPIPTVASTATTHPLIRYYLDKSEDDCYRLLVKLESFYLFALTEARHVT